MGVETILLIGVIVTALALIGIKLQLILETVDPSKRSIGEWVCIIALLFGGWLTIIWCALWMVAT